MATGKKGRGYEGMCLLDVRKVNAWEGDASLNPLSHSGCSELTRCYVSTSQLT